MPHGQAAGTCRPRSPGLYDFGMASSGSTLRSDRVQHKVWWVACVGTLAMVTGCQKVLFPADEPRTQYQKADQLRDRFTPLVEPDVFGNPKPALRARLAPQN